MSGHLSEDRWRKSEDTEAKATAWQAHRPAGQISQIILLNLVWSIWKLNIILFLARQIFPPWRVFGSSARLLSFPIPEACWCTSRIRERQVTKQLTKITVKMQNKPNLRNDKMNVTSVTIRNYEDIRLCSPRKNKPNVNTRRAPHKKNRFFPLNPCKVIILSLYYTRKVFFLKGAIYGRQFGSFQERWCLQEFQPPQHSNHHR